MTDVYFGTTIPDPYRWLENWHEGKAAGWLRDAGRVHALRPAAISGRDKFLARVKSLDTASTGVRNTQSWGGKLFYLKADQGADNVKLYVKEQGSTERLLVDPELLTKDGVHYSIDYYQPSLDGRLVVYGISPAVRRTA